MPRHYHVWGVVQSVPGQSCVISCSCGGIIRVRRTGKGLRPEVVQDGPGGFSLDDGQRVVLLAVSVIGSP
jgi:hypothetical protein